MYVFFPTSQPCFIWWIWWHICYVEYETGNIYTLARLKINHSTSQIWIHFIHLNILSNLKVWCHVWTLKIKTTNTIWSDKVITLEMWYSLRADADCLGIRPLRDTSANRRGIQPSLDTSTYRHRDVGYGHSSQHINAQGVQYRFTTPGQGLHVSRDTGNDFFVSQISGGSVTFPGTLLVR